MLGMVAIVGAAERDPSLAVTQVAFGLKGSIPYTGIFAWILNEDSCTILSQFDSIEQICYALP